MVLVIRPSGTLGGARGGWGGAGGLLWTPALSFENIRKGLKKKVKLKGVDGKRYVEHLTLFYPRQQT